MDIAGATSLETGGAILSADGNAGSRRSFREAINNRLVVSCCREANQDNRWLCSILELVIGAGVQSYDPL